MLVIFRLFFISILFITSVVYAADLSFSCIRNRSEFGILDIIVTEPDGQTVNVRAHNSRGDEIFKIPHFTAGRFSRDNVCLRNEKVYIVHGANTFVSKRKVSTLNTRIILRFYARNPGRVESDFRAAIPGIDFLLDLVTKEFKIS